MANPRQAIEAQMVAALEAIQPAAYAVPKGIWKVTQNHVLLADVPDEFRPTLVLLTEEGPSPFVGLGGVQETTLRLAILIYLTIHPGDEAAVICDQYAEAVRHCLAVHRHWGGLAIVTEITGVPTHQLLTLPDALVTLQAEVTYRHIDAEVA